MQHTTRHDTSLHYTTQPYWLFLHMYYTTRHPILHYTGCFTRHYTTSTGGSQHRHDTEFSETTCSIALQHYASTYVLHYTTSDTINGRLYTTLHHTTNTPEGSGRSVYLAHLEANNTNHPSTTIHLYFVNHHVTTTNFTTHSIYRVPNIL